MKRVIYCFFATVICLARICGCQPTPPRRADCLFAPFRAEIAGEVRGVSFSAMLVGEGGEGTVEIAYLTPDALSGVRVRAPLTADGSLGESAELSLGELSAQLPAEAAEGLLLPARILFSHAREDAATVQRTEEGYCFTFADGVALSVSAEGVPLSVCAPDLSYQIVWWERQIGESAA